MNTLWHILLSALVALIFTRDPQAVFLIALGAGIIDLDHVFHVLVQQRITDPKKALAWARKENRLQRTHFYAFHNIEFQLLFLVVAYIVHPLLFLVAVGFAMHFLQDTLNYVYHAHPGRPWWRYKSVYLYLRHRPPR